MGSPLKEKKSGGEEKRRSTSGHTKDRQGATDGAQKAPEEKSKEKGLDDKKDHKKKKDKKDKKEKKHKKEKKRDDESKEMKDEERKHKKEKKLKVLPVAPRRRSAGRGTEVRAPSSLINL